MSMSKKAMKRIKRYRKRKSPPPQKKHGPLYRMPFRRRREQKTDYGQRTRLLKSGKIRVAIRPSNKALRIQFIRSQQGGDQTITQVLSKDLAQYGWDIATSNMPAAYLTGFLAGKRALKADIGEAILDIGTLEALPKTRLFAALKGIVDAGVEIPYGEKMIPDEERIRGEHIANYGRLLAKEDKEKYNRYFGKYLQVNKKPEEIQTYFEETRTKIEESE
ncbi:MAG: 50S ribosomal protein L18 [Candidatus Heimdallarchaeaceae archaeon]